MIGVCCIASTQMHGGCDWQQPLARRPRSLHGSLPPCNPDPADPSLCRVFFCLASGFSSASSSGSLRTDGPRRGRQGSGQMSPGAGRWPPPPPLLCPDPYLPRRGSACGSRRADRCFPDATEDLPTQGGGSCVRSKGGGDGQRPAPEDIRTQGPPPCASKIRRPRKDRFRPAPAIAMPVLVPRLEHQHVPQVHMPFPLAAQVCPNP